MESLVISQHNSIFYLILNYMYMLVEQQECVGHATELERSDKQHLEEERDEKGLWLLKMYVILGCSEDKCNQQGDTCISK